MEFKYQFLEDTFNTSTHPLRRAIYHHIEAVVVDWCEQGSPRQPRAIITDLYENIRTLLKRMEVTETHTSTIKSAVDKIQNMYEGKPVNPNSRNPKIIELDPLVFPIEWDDIAAKRMGVLQGITNPQNIDRIRRSSVYPRDYLMQSSEYDTANRLRYVKWANIIINTLGDSLNTISGDHRDLDLWVLAKVFERRELLEGKEGMDDLNRWLDYKPFLSPENGKSYLDLIDRGVIPPLRQAEYLTKDEIGIAVGIDEDFLGSWKDYPEDQGEWTDANAWYRPESKFLIAESLFGFIKAKEPSIQKLLSNRTYLLPSQQIGLFMQMFDTSTGTGKAKLINRDVTNLFWGKRSSPAYKLDIKDFPRIGQIGS